MKNVIELFNNYQDDTAIFVLSVNKPAFNINYF